MLMVGWGTAAAADTDQGQPAPDAAPSSQPAAGPETPTANGSRPESGTDLEASPPGRQDPWGVWIVNTPQVTLSNTVTDADGDDANLTFEVWKADTAGNPTSKVSISDDPYGVLVSGYVESGSVASVTVGPGKLDPNVDYLFHTSAYDGGLYETEWSDWEPFRVELPVDLTLPDPDFDSPDPSWFDVEPVSEQTKPLGAAPTMSSESTDTEQCGPVNDGRQVCFGPRLTELPDSQPPEAAGPLSAEDLKAQATVDIPEAEWCDTLNQGVLSDRFTQCDRRILPVHLIDVEDGSLIAETRFAFTRRLVLDGTDSFSEYMTVKPYEPVADGFGQIDASILGHECGEDCTPAEPDPSDWEGEPSWGPGDQHPAWVKTSYDWDASTTDQEYLFQPDVTLGMSVQDSVPILSEYVWSLDPWLQAEDLDQVRCDTKGSGSKTSGCVFLNAAPTYPFNSASYPQAAAHAWLIQTMTPHQPGSQSADKPMYYMGDDRQQTRNRGRICKSGWAADNGDASALDDDLDTLNCDEFAFASSYNSGGMAASEGGLNEAVPEGSTRGTPNGSACIQTFAKEHEDEIHLYNIDGMIPDFTEVCGRSAMSGYQNQGSMNRFGAFMTDMRIMDGDAYWLDPRMSGTCLYTTDWGTPADPVICLMATT